MSAFRFARAFTVPKHESTPNEDRWHASPDGLVCAISDGASISYDPAPWAEKLVGAFVENPAPSNAWLSVAAEQYATNYDRSSMEWMQEAAFDKGSFASLLGLVIHPKGRSMRAFAIGDSMLALIGRDGRLHRTLPYEQPEQFDQSPQLFSTNPAENSAFSEEVFRDSWHELPVEDSRATVLLMTDALGRWLLDEPTPERVAFLTSVRDGNAFAEWVADERLSGRMRRDDTTLLVVGRPR